MSKNIFGNAVSPWTEVKLDHIEKYLSAYSNILYVSGFREYYFVDGFAGRGYCIRKSDGKIINGSSLISLLIDPPFTKYFFIELDEEKVEGLRKIVSRDFTGKNVTIYQGDCNTEIVNVLKSISSSTPFVALLDPQAGDLKWETVQKISNKNKAEVIINFPFGVAINRKMSLSDEDSINKSEMNAIFGSAEWEQIYEARQRGLAPSIAREKYLDLYLGNLVQTGFKYYAVKNVKDTRGRHIYYLIFGTKNLKGLIKMKDEFVRGEAGRDTLFFKMDLVNLVYQYFQGRKNLSLTTVLDRLLPGKHLYREQDFKDALVQLEKSNRLIRLNPRPRARSFKTGDLFKIV